MWYMGNIWGGFNFEEGMEDLNFLEELERRVEILRGIFERWLKFWEMLHFEYCFCLILRTRYSYRWLNQMLSLFKEVENTR